MSNEFLPEIRKKIIYIKNNIVLLDPTYSDLEQKIHIILNQIELYLPEDKKSLCKYLDQLYSLQEGVSDEIIYMQAIKNTLK